jgi:hypothetical protein
MRLMARENENLYLDIEDVFIFWLEHISGVEIVDPYADKILYEYDQLKILSVLKGSYNALREGIITSHEFKNNLPKDDTLRNEILDILVNNEMKKDKNWETLSNLEALLELMVENDYSAFCLGD